MSESERKRDFFLVQYKRTLTRTIGTFELLNVMSKRDVTLGFVLHRYRHGRREREAVEIHNKSRSGSPRPKRRSPRLTAAGAGGGSSGCSPATSWASPAGSTTMDGSLFASPMSSPGLEEALKKGRGSTKKPGVGSVISRRPLHSQKVVPECTGVVADDGVRNICLIALAVVGIVFLLWVILPYFKGATDPVLGSEAPSKSQRQIILEKLGSEFQELRRKFHQQDRRLWSVVAAATKRVVQDEYPVQPAVLMLVSPPGGSDGDKWRHRLPSNAYHRRYSTCAQQFKSAEAQFTRLRDVIRQSPGCAKIRTRRHVEFQLH